MYRISVKPFFSHLCTMNDKTIRLKKTLLGFALLLTSLLAYRCANPGMPQGGPKDAEAPHVVLSEPPDFTRHFKSERIVIEFNEYINVKDVNKQFLASPRFNKQPEFKVQGRRFVIELQDSLRKKTTYSLYFGDAIGDLTEGNPVTDFSYVFSTGSAIDSMELGGIIRNAFDLKPIENVVAMLYLDENDTISFDSLPLLVPPYYIAKTNKEGKFSLRNLRPEKYLLFALKDANANYYFDQPNEEIAFVDSLIVALPAEVIIPDTLKSDSLSADSLHLKDSLPEVDILKEKIPKKHSAKSDPKAQYELRLFMEADTVQRIANSTVSNDHQVFIQFKQAVDSLHIQVLTKDSSTYEPLQRITAGRDSLWMWFPNYLFDSTTLIVSAKGMKADTLEFKLAKEDAQGKSRAKKDKKDVLNIAGPPFTSDFFKPSRLLFGNPVLTQNIDSFEFYTSTDTLKVGVRFADSLKRQALFNYKLEPANKYRMYLPEGSFTDIFGKKSDSTVFEFSTRPADAYGSFKLKVDVQDTAAHYILQMLTEKDVVLFQDTLSATKDFVFEYLMPQKLKFKAILDANANGKWDTGRYLRKQQPEKVIFFSKPVEIRANWQVEEEWKLDFGK